MAGDQGYQARAHRVGECLEQGRDLIDARQNKSWVEGTPNSERWEIYSF